MVISEKIEDVIHPEQRMHTFEDVDKRARTGAPSSLARHNMGLSTVIGRENEDASGLGIGQYRRNPDVLSFLHRHAGSNQILDDCSIPL
jgi:transcription initiation factor TFIIIB Brf1 subunit/transcription initiation factor TFIIB